MSDAGRSLISALRVELWWQVEKRIPHSGRNRFDRFAAFVYRHRKQAERRRKDRMGR